MNFKNSQDLYMTLYVYLIKYSSSSFFLIKMPNDIGWIFQKPIIIPKLFMYILMTSMTHQYFAMLIVAYQ